MFEDVLSHKQEVGREKKLIYEPTIPYLKRNNTISNFKCDWTIIWS